MIEIERALELADLDFGGLGFGLVQHAHDTRPGNPGDQREDGKHHQQFQKRKTGPAGAFDGVHVLILSGAHPIGSLLGPAARSVQCPIGYGKARGARA